MLISTPYATAIIYVVGAFLTVAALMASYKPQQWLVHLVPENTVEPGDDILVPVGSCENTRRMRVMSMLGPDKCKAIDLRDQQHHNGLALGIGVAWPIMVPMTLIAMLLQAIMSRQGSPASRQAMAPKPRPREDMAECMRKVDAWNA